MGSEGKYLYCIIGENPCLNYGPVGIGGRGDIVSTIGYNDISAVISNTPMARYVISRENLTLHEEVIETVMKDQTVLPVRFCTIAANAEEIRMVLRKRYAEFKGLLRDMDNKIEMGVKVHWKSMAPVFQDIDQSDETVQQLKRTLAGNPEDEGLKGGLGEAVKKAVSHKRSEESWSLINRLRRVSVDVKEKPSIADSMVLNAVCLIDRSHEKAFDYLIDELAEKHVDQFSFVYVGPAPPFHFINIEIKA